jgi:hypothetical protein
MAKPYPILPSSILDELHGLNCSLGAYQVMLEATIRHFCTQGTPLDYESFLHGLDDLFQPILEGYKSIESQATAFREMGVVGVCTLDEADQEKP